MIRFKGSVVWFNNGKGFGFLSNGNEPDVFCHFSAIERDGYKSLKEGDDVEYEIVEDAKGRLQAANVKLVT